MSFYLDASVIVPTLFKENATEAVDSFLSAQNDTLVVSDFAVAEVASALSRLVRMKLLMEVKANALLAEFDAWRAAATLDIDLQASDIRLANIFVRRFDLGLRAPDALHVAVCRRGDYRLVTLDRRLAEATEALGVRVEMPA